MATTVKGWTTLAEEPLVLAREYSFGGGLANAFAVGLPERRFLIMSPPIGLSSEEMRAFAAHGSVVALLENNGAHHMGLGPWQGAFPEAVTYAAPRAAARIRKKGKDFGALEPIEKLQPLLGDRVSVFAVPGDKIGDVCVRVRSDKGVVLYAGDYVANMPELPRNFFVRTFMKLTDSAPGLKVFGIFLKFFVADREAALGTLIREVEANPPAILVPAHGGVVAQSNLGSTLAAMFRARM